MFLTFTSGCSVFNEGRNLSNDLFNKLNKEIIENFSEAITKDPDNYLFYLERGKAKHDFGDYVGAIKDFNSSLRLNPDLKIMFHIANSKYNYGDHIGASEDYQKSILNEDFKDEAFFNIANSQLILLNYAEAIKNYTYSIELDQDDQNAYLNRGNAKFKINDYEGSLKDYEKPIDINKKSYIAFNN